MAATAAQVRANQINAQKSTGPKTPEGKEHSRANALKHGLTGAGIVLPEADAAEVNRRAAAYAQELHASGEVQYALARRAALNSLRMERGADQQSASLAQHVRQVEADFVAHEGLDEAAATKLRAEAVRRAMFDPSREASLARKYEASAERGFFRALSELRVLQKAAKQHETAVKTRVFQEELGSIMPQELSDDELDAMIAMYESKTQFAGRGPAKPGASVAPAAPFDLPFAVGKAR